MLSNSSATAEAQGFRCEVRPEREVVIVAPFGELDMATAPVVDEQLSELRDAGFQHVALDLRGLQFMDANGLALLLRWTQGAEWCGIRFSVIPGSPAVHRVLEVSGANPLLPFVTEAELRY